MTEFVPVFDFLNSFHFLRPLWLIGLLLCPLLWRFQARGRQLEHDWARTIDPKLLAYLTPHSERTTAQADAPQRTGRTRLLPWLLALCLLALAGPSWEQKPQPVMQLQDQMVVIVDLSLSMLATDLPPNRLTRAKQKLQDLLNLRQEGNTALIVFSGDAHVVTPLTDDTNTISANIPALDPYLMPVIGARPDRAVAEAIKLFEQAGARQGRLILLTDGVEPAQAERIHDTLKDGRYTLHILAVGTPGGGPVQLKDGQYLKDNGSVVIPKTDLDLLNQLANENNGIMRVLALDDSDLAGLDISAQVLKAQFNQSELERRSERFDAWEDHGYLLLALIVPLVLLAYRQGALLILLLVLLPNDRAAAFSWADLWQTRDQQAQQKLADDPKAAAELFESLEHKAFAQARANDFANAAENFAKNTFAKNNSANAHYNRGNALAYAGKLEEAIAAYEQALKLAPDMQDAKDNKALVEDLLKQQQEQQQEQQENQKDQDQNQQQDQQQKQDQEQQSGQDSQQQQQGQQGEQSQQQQGSEQKNAEQQNAEQAQQAKEKAEQAQQEEAAQAEQQQNQATAPGEESKDSEQEPDGEATQGAVEELDSEEKQSFEQWMRRVPDDPGGLLREKFKQQAKERNQIEKEEGEPLW